MRGSPTVSCATQRQSCERVRATPWAAVSGRNGWTRIGSVRLCLRKAGGFWVYVYLFAKNDRENITPKELRAFKKLAGDYQGADVGQMLKNGDLHEICKDEQEG